VRLRSLAVECTFDAQALSRQLGVSRRQLNRQFNLTLGCSPQRWLNEQRILTAQQMLTSASSVKQVAYLLGFKQVSQFCRDYRARFGHPPSSDLRALASARAATCTPPDAGPSCLGHIAGERCSPI
jgi:AraC family carnitine catabolism transcriptional activator